MAKPAAGAVRRRGRKVDDNEPADEPSSRGNSKNAASGASAPGASKGKKRDAAPKKPAKDGGRVVSRTKRQSAKARVDLVKRLAAFVCVACLAVYLRAIPMGAIPEAFQDRVEHAMPHWLNSSMHLLNGLPALNTTAFNGNGRRGSPSPGAQARAAGRKPHHPVVIVPGFISSGLELWEGHDCGRHFFRQRMWGTPAMARAYFADRACWMQHMRLDPKTGLDPSGIKLRAVTGLEAVDWFVPGYFVWGKVIESLGDDGGESSAEVSTRALRVLEQKARVVVFGSSTGWLVFYASLVFGARSVGYELLEGRVATANETARECVFPSERESGKNTASVSDLFAFSCSDALFAPLGENAKVVVLTSQCWDEALKTRVASRLASHLTVGALVVDYGDSLKRERAFGEPVAVVEAPTSWNEKQKFYVFQKKQ